MSINERIRAMYIYKFNICIYILRYSLYLKFFLWLEQQCFVTLLVQCLFWICWCVCRYIFSKNKKKTLYSLFCRCYNLFYYSTPCALGSATDYWKGKHNGGSQTIRVWRMKTSLFLWVNHSFYDCYFCYDDHFLSLKITAYVFILVMFLLQTEL